MAIKFEDRKAGDEKPAAKSERAKEPPPEVESAIDPDDASVAVAAPELPFAKPSKPDKKRKGR